MNNPSVSTPLRIAAAQSPSVPGDVARNVLTHLAFVRVAASEGVQVLLFPELSLTGYEPTVLAANVLDADHAALAPLRQAARDQGMAIVVGGPAASVQAGALPAIGAWVLAPDGSVALYRKRHLHASEERFASAGTHDAQVHLLAGEPTGMAVCADITHPEHARAAHGAGGFTVYRPDHWSLKGTGLGYGDVLGASSKIFGYEVDGIDYETRKGLPHAAEGTGLEGELTIVGLSPATTLSHHTGPHDMDYFIGTLDAEEVAQTIYGEITPETLGLASRGNGCMAEYRRGRGAVYNAGSCEWVAGLIARERPVEVVTKNILLGDWG